MRTFIAIAASWAAAAALAAPVTPGNLVVVRVGGTGGAAQASSLMEYTTAGGLVQSFALPTADGTGGNQTCTMAGSIGAGEGQLSLSTNGQYLTLACNDMAVGTTVATSSLDRVVARVDLGGNIDTTTRFNLGSNWTTRGVVMDGNNIWVGGSAGTRSVAYTTFGASSATVLTTSLGARAIREFGGQLYISEDRNTSTPQGVFSVGAGLPTNLGITPALLPGFPTNNNNFFDIWDFWFADASTIFLADARTTGAGGGLQKWTFDGSTWTRQYTLAAGLTNGLWGLTGVVNGGVPTIYATTVDNKLVAVTDPDAGGASFSTLVTGDAGSMLRGVVLVPEPASIVLCLVGVGLLRRR